jgi:hypothetical protein
MSVSSPYAKHLWIQMFDRDVERLLSGLRPHNKELVELKSLVSAMAELGKIRPSEELIAHYAAVAARTVAESRPRPVPAVDRPTNRGIGLAIHRRAVAAMASLVMVVGLTGVAWASDSAGPGDWNYGIDLALERVGIGAGGAAERLEEVSSMIFRDEPSILLEEDPAVYSTESSRSAGEALRQAAERVASLEEGSEQARLAKERVSELLEYLSQKEEKATPGEVAELAKSIGHDPEGPPTTAPQGNRNPKGNSQGSPKGP